MKVLLLGGSAHGQEREAQGSPTHVVWADVPPARVIMDPLPRPTIDAPRQETYLAVKFGRQDTRQTRVAFVYEPQRHLADQLLNSYLRCRWLAEDDQ